jgi:hypothetical protein
MEARRVKGDLDEEGEKIDGIDTGEPCNEESRIGLRAPSIRIVPGKDKAGEDEEEGDCEVSVREELSVKGF